MVIFVKSNKCLFRDAASGSRTSNSDGIGFFNPVMAFMGHNVEEDSTEVSKKPQSPKNSPAEEENHSTPSKQQTSDVDASEVSGTTKSPKQPSKAEEAHNISTESHVSKADVSEQSMTPQTPTHPSAVEENFDGSIKSPVSKGDDSSQSPTHPSTAEETHSVSIENISSVMNENQDHQDSKHSGPCDEAQPNQLGESVGNIPDGGASSPTKIDQSGDTKTGESILIGKEETSDGNALQSQPAESVLASSDGMIEAEDKIDQQSDASKEISSPHDSADTVDKATHVEVKVHDENTNTEKNEVESNKTEAGAASVNEQEDIVPEQPEEFRSKSIIAEHDSHLQNESVVNLTDAPAEPVEVGSPANDFRKEEKTQQSVRRTNSSILESAGSVVELEKLRREMKMMDAALQGAARQSQVSFPHALISALAIQ